MFTKPFRVKSHTPIKGSDRKKVKAELKQAFPELSDENLNTIIPNKEDMSVMKIETHSGEIVTAHCLGKKPIIFHIRDALYPTIYLLWMMPHESLPYFTTWYVVVPKFANGADLMLPGIIVNEELGMRCYGRLPKGKTVAVNTNYNSAAVAVGRTALSGEDMYMAGRRGKGVEIIHCFGDKLWELGGKESPPEMGPPAVMLTSSNQEQDPTEAATEATAGQVDETTAVTTEAAPETSATPGTEAGGNVEEATETGPQKSPQEIMDELLDYCFLKALKTTAKKIELPALTSNFFRLHMIPACPSDKSLDVKKSSYKKLSKFLDVMKREGVVTVKELTKGVESITEINFAHDRIRRFKVQDDGEEPRKEGALESVKDIGKYLPPVISQLYLVNAATVALFSTASIRKGASLRAQDVRAFLTDYVKNNNLQDETSKSHVKLDPILSDVVLKKGENNVLKLTWEELMSRVTSKLSTAFEMAFPNSEPVTVKGQLEPVEITTASRAGNKKVTLVSGLETFRIDLDQFAHRCQVGVAASTTITTSPAKKGQVVLVQGNQVVFVGNLLLEEYAIPKQFILGLDTKSKGKSKK